jgi:hypothetical protein
MLKMKTTITGISGVGSGTAKTLHEQGYKTLSAIAGATIEQLSSVPGFGTTRASRVIRAANELLATTASSTARETHIGARQQRIARKPVANTTKSGQSNETPVEKATKKDQEKASKAKRKEEKEARRKEKKEKKARLKKEKEKAAKLKKKKEKEAKARKKKAKHKKNKK